MLKLSVIGLLFVAFAVPASSQEKRPRGDQPKDLQDAVALAEAQVHIKRAAVKVADAQKRIAEAKLKVIKTKLRAPEHIEAEAANRLQRLEALRSQSPKAVPVEEFSAAVLTLHSARAAKLEAEGNVLIGEAEVAFELARRELAEAALQEAELRAKQLRERLKPKK